MGGIAIIFATSPYLKIWSVSLGVAGGIEDAAKLGLLHYPPI
jgi:hypothetical protein